MTSPLLLVSEFPVEPNAVDKAVTVIREQVSGDGRPQGSLYRGLEAPTVLELTPVDTLAQLDPLLEGWGALFAELAPLLTGDVRRQALRFVGAPKPAAEQLPDTRYVQLRHVEVRPPVYEEYLAWREGTIFAEVHKSPKIETFLAYHSLVSTEPGVMFVSGFSCPPEEYLQVFTSERYAEIGRQAHPRFVTDEGLYTRLYERLTGAEGA
ncbi:hypothetical protein IL992_06140 [Microbispora sp. NEAU-D428]|uniref:hypothetical protein n=1 Tax=Microbispora sitophila TaxID=2771537 RepID=UPI001866ED34|nr:hypothetical protein [Microbispora sitophila]MBE3008768.1 hypothetical protein [Microbispora sitophila]